jgi:hypothetical protein
MAMTRTRRFVFASAAGIGILMGAAGVSAAATNPSSSARPAVSSPKQATSPEQSGGESTNATDPANGANCENGIIKATGAECDGGPAANKANDPTEAGQAKESGKQEAANNVSDVNEGAETVNG